VSVADRERLQKELADVQAEIAQLQKRLGDKGNYSLGEGDPTIIQWEINLALLQKSEQKVQQLQEALANLLAGTYGACEVCGQPIEPERLEILPQTKRCATCARGQQRPRL
jgi:RNA polymerase-binding transcription factor DksA